MKLGNMMLQETDGVPYLTFPVFSRLDFVRHAFSTRIGGVSTGEFASMNLSFDRGDSRETVQENYTRFCRAAGFQPESLVASSQVHGTEIRRVTEQDCGAGIWRCQDRQAVDGLVTNTPGVTLVTSYADCTPLFFVDPVHRAIGLAHAGWRGTVARIGRVMAERMQREFSTDPRDLMVGIGPSIGACCYEVDKDCAAHFLALEPERPLTFVRPKGYGKYWVNLWEANRRVLMAAGVRPQAIVSADLCTRCHSDLLWSHRATNGRRGGMCAFLQIASA